MDLHFFVVLSIIPPPQERDYTVREIINAIILLIE